MDIRLLGVGDVRVRVDGPDNLPVVGASVTLTTAFPRDGGAQVQLSDTDGYVTFRHVVEGPYAVEAKLLGTPRWASMRASMQENPPLMHQDSLTWSCRRWTVQAVATQAKSSAQSQDDFG